MNERDHRYPVTELHIGRGKQLYAILLERINDLLLADQRVLIRVRTERGDVVVIANNAGLVAVETLTNVLPLLGLFGHTGKQCGIGGFSFFVPVEILARGLPLRCHLVLGLHYHGDDERAGNGQIRAEQVREVIAAHPQHEHVRVILQHKVHSPCCGHTALPVSQADTHIVRTDIDADTLINTALMQFIKFADTYVVRIQLIMTGIQHPVNQRGQFLSICRLCENFCCIQ